ncbi:MAG: CapA family protein [Bacillota bacterium]|nr:CapA family protein [Bacillota bacterium]
MGSRSKRNNKNKRRTDIFKLSIIMALILVLAAGAVIILMKQSGSTSSIPQGAGKNTGTTAEPEKTPPPKQAESTPEAGVPETPAKKDTNVLLSAVGDCTIGTDTKFNQSTSLPVVVQKHDNDLSYLFSNVSSIFKNDNITIANLETTFTNSSSRRDKNAEVQYSFKGDPELAKSLVLGSVEAVNVSNNHIYDFGDEGFKDTLDTLKAENVAYFGEGNQWVTEVNGVTFGFLGYQGWSADSSFLKKLKNDITALKTKASVVVVTFHWGVERSYTPNDVQQKLAHYAVDCGADLIIGHHPHVVQGIEKYKDRFICYSLGNFCFGGNSNPSDKDTFIFQADFKFQDKKLNSIGVKAIPCRISSVSSYNDYRPTPMTGDNKSKLLKKLNGLSTNIGFEISDNFNYSAVK